MVNIVTMGMFGGAGQGGTPVPVPTNEPAFAGGGMAVVEKVIYRDVPLPTIHVKMKEDKDKEIIVIASINTSEE